MTTIHIAQDGTESVATTVLVRTPLRNMAKQEGISLSGTLNEALKKKLEDQGEKLAGDLATGHHRGTVNRGAVNSERECI